jgi:PilZ domain
MMAERRKHPRTELNEAAYVSAGGSVMSCVIRNISLDGAAIEVDNPAFVPERFRLVMSDHTVHECRVIWIRDNRIGLALLTPPQSAKPGDD